jgi:large repetitive protein
VLANDTGDGKTVADNGNPKHGAVTCAANGSCTYTPARGYTG